MTKILIDDGSKLIQPCVKDVKHGDIFRLLNSTDTNIAGNVFLALKTDMYLKFFNLSDDEKRSWCLDYSTLVEIFTETRLVLE